MTFTSRWLEWKPDAEGALATDTKIDAHTTTPPTKPTKPPGERAAEGVLSVLAVPLQSAGDFSSPKLAPPAPPGARAEAPRPGGEPRLLAAEDLGAVPSTPHAEVEADWRRALALAREGFARHGGPPGGREAHRFVRDAATLEALLLTREREWTTWRERWRACLEGVYVGKVALLPGLEGALLAAWRPRLEAGGGRALCQRCGAPFERPADLSPHVPAQRCPACASEDRP